MWILVGIYTLCSATGLMLLKKGVSEGFLLTVAAGSVELRFRWVLILGALLYVCSFFLNLYCISKINLTYFYPVSAGIVYILICLGGYFFLREDINLTQGIGMGIILLGITIMNLHTTSGK